MIAKLLIRRPITGRDTLYVFECPDLARAAYPGQFVELKLTEGPDPFLRRPISIFDCDGQSTFTLLVRTVGRGTALMSRWRPGAEVDVLGPLGHGFQIDQSGGLCALVGGGIGVAPLNYLARALLRRGRQVRLLFAPRRESALLLALPEADRLSITFAENRAALPAALHTAISGASQVFACGPDGMLEITAQRAAALGVPCQLSMERRMACGIGICLGCAVAVRTEQGLTYQKVCKDGPVFEAEEVSFHEGP